MAESFNAWILSAQEKRIITMCEEIRVQLMTRFEEKRELGNTWSGMLVPKAQELLDNCRKWQLNGILCTHAIAAINHMHLDPTVYCLKFFTAEYFKRAFETPFTPVLNDIELTGIYNRTVLLPRTTNLPGRPKNQRRISEMEHPITRPLKCK
ncbi:hypothetical protein AMTR_s00108p00146880 [Amborella trichopoda]|uniref:Zinc finger PMZ-type domain-containing protein n=1 Tax=Amborella trichopoda TaxID=13333 RepID=W1NVK0_AMBTC|nr:hypothetical protein AMTR_s00108p00146880 [Amborella trichopoda]